MKIVILFALLLSSCGAKEKHLNTTTMKDNKDKLKFEGSLRSLPRVNPWDPMKVEYRNKLGNVSVTGIPLETEIMVEILSGGNFEPNVALMQEVVNLYFQGSNSRCPDGDDFSAKEVDGVSICEMNTVDRTGRLWRLKIEREAGKYRFSSRKTRKVYDHLFRFGG